MVYGKRRRSSKRSFRRRVRPRRRSLRKRSMRTTVARARTSLLPDRFLVKLKYSQLIGMSFTGSGAANYLQFRINSIYDPYATGTGSQPLGHDQWATLYNRYRVFGMKYMVTFTNQESTKHIEYMVQVRPNNTVDTNIETIREAPYTLHKGVMGVEGSGQAVRVCRGYADVAKVRGISRGRIKYETDYQALFGASPIIQAFLNIYIANQNTLEPAVANCRVDLMYYCELFDRKIQASS